MTSHTNDLGKNSAVGELDRLQPLIDALSTYGERLAILALKQSASERWSYADVSDHVRRLAAGLIEVGVERETHVALLAGNQPEWIIACLAIIRAGAVAVPVDVQVGDDGLYYVLQDSEASLIFTTAEQAERLERLDLAQIPETILLDVGINDSRSWRQKLGDNGAVLPQIEPDDEAVLFYTSGTTGPPKGVPLTHKNLVFQLNAIIEAEFVTKTDRVLLPLPLHHVYPFSFGMLAPLAIGLPIIFPQALTGPQTIRALREGEATLIIGVPRLYRALYEGIEARVASGGFVVSSLFKVMFGLSHWLRRRLGLRLGKMLLRSLHRQFGANLRVLASGGAALDPELAWKLEALGWQVGIGYGLTETAPLLTLNTPGKIRISSVGRPLPGVDVRLDPAAQPGAAEQDQKGFTNEPDIHGEVLAQGPNVFTGYRHLPDKSDEAFTDGWFRTGDLGYFDHDGYLYITGRVSTVIVTESGKNIQPDAVEEVYLNSPAIAEIGVLQKDGRLVGLIVPELSEIPRGSGEEIETAIQQAVEQQSKHLPSYQRISDYAITRETLPQTRLGKIRRHLLAERYEQAKRGEEEPVEAGGPISMEEMSPEDRTLLENPAAREVWNWLGQHYADRRLTPDTNLQLDLGIDSLGWLNLTLEISERVGVELDDEAIARINTIRDLLHEVTDSTAPGRLRQTSPLEAGEDALSEEQKRWLKPLGPVGSLLARGMFGLNRWLMRLFLRLEVKGFENVPHEGPFMITPNHVSYLDALMVAAALDYRCLRQTYFAGAVTVVFTNPVLRLVSRLSQTVPIDSDRAAASSLAFAAAVLKRGHNMVWFPEGRRSLSGKLEPFKPGIGLLLERFQVPAVPVFIHGTREAMPPDRFWPKPVRVTVAFGRPATPEELEREGEGERPAERIAHALHNRVAELSSQV